MTRLHARRKLPSDGANSPLPAWLVPSGLLIGGLLGVALSVATLEASWSGEIIGAVAPELQVRGTFLGATARQVLQVTVPVSPAGQGPSAFGYLEFDWDPHAPGGVPGFGSWPS